MASDYDKTIQLETHRLLLRIALPEMVDEILDFRMRNRDFLQPWLPLQNEFAFDREFNASFLRNERNDWLEGRSYRFMVSLLEKPDYIIGDIRFSNIVRGAFQNSYLGYLQDEAHCGHGYMSEALSKAIWYMFAIEQLHRIEANIMPRNTPSINLIRKLGFTEVGRSPRYLQINGEWEDHLHFAILNE